LHLKTQGKKFKKLPVLFLVDGSLLKFENITALVDFCDFFPRFRKIKKRSELKVITGLFQSKKKTNIQINNEKKMFMHK